MYEKVLSYDPLTGTKEIFRIKDDQTFEVVTVVDVEPILEYAQDERKQFRGVGGGQWNHKGLGWNKVATVPLGVLQREVFDKGLDKDHKAMMKWLDQSDQSVFRTRPGRLA